MKRLILFRHGKTERHAPSGDDFDRRLTVRGVEDGHLMGKVLAEAGLIPGLALVSAAQRARETWDAARTAFPDAESEIRRDLYNADARDILRTAKAATAETVMAVAHNPGMHALTVALLERAGDDARLADVREGFPTAGVSAFAFEGEEPACLGLFFPRDHGGGGGFE
jgi:phosphohistidine phosphatase